ncbi:MAG: hypothetical protein ABJG88_05960, partial [Litorimonas sp.]
WLDSIPVNEDKFQLTTPYLQIVDSDNHKVELLVHWLSKYVEDDVQDYRMEVSVLTSGFNP